MNFFFGSKRILIGWYCFVFKLKYNYKYLLNGIMIVISWYNCIYICINIIFLMLQDNFKWNFE